MWSTRRGLGGATLPSLRLALATSCQLAPPGTRPRRVSSGAASSCNGVWHAPTALAPWLDMGPTRVTNVSLCAQVAHLRFDGPGIRLLLVRRPSPVGAMHDQLIPQHPHHLRVTQHRAVLGQQLAWCWRRLPAVRAASLPEGETSPDGGVAPAEVGVEGSTRSWSGGSKLGTAATSTPGRHALEICG